MRHAHTQTMSFTDLLTELLRAHTPRAALALVAMWLGAALMPVASFIAVGIFLVITDWLTGISAARVRGVPITSAGLWRTIRKAVFYPVAIISSLVVERTFFQGSEWLVYLVAAYIALTELFSNLENISVITGTDIIGAVRRYARRRLGEAQQPSPPPKDLE